MSDRNSPEFAQFKAAIFGQESNNGKVATDTPNYAGALGKGQILESTFKGLQKAGKVPADYQWANPEHNEFAAVEYMAEAWEAGKGRPDLAAAYYYGGPKAVQNGQIVSYRDLKNPKAPDTVGYADSILKRMGRSAEPVLSPQGVPLRPAVPDWADRRAEAMQARRDEVLNRPGALVKLGAAMTNATTGRAYSAIREMMSGVRGEFDDEADYTYQPPKELLVGQSADRQAERLEARSTRELSYIMDRQAEGDERMKVLAADGMWSGLAWGVAGEAADLSNWFAPLAASRLLGMKSAIAAAQGQKAATFGYAATENLIAGTAIEGTLQVLEQRPDPANFALAATVDIGVSLAQTASLLRSARAFQGVQDAAVREVATFEKAAANLGPGAKPEQVEAEYQRIRFEEIREPVAASIAPVPHRAKLMDDPDEVPDGGDDLFKATEAPAVEVAEVPAQAAEPTFKKEGDVFVAEFPNDQGGKGYIELSEVDGRVFPSMVDNGLPPGQSSGKVVQAYEDAIEFAQQQGKQFTSDDSVTPEAARVYDALAKRGYAVEKNPNARLATKPEALTDRWVTDDGAPVYTVEPKQAQLSATARDDVNMDVAVPKKLFGSPGRVVALNESGMSKDLQDAVQAIRDMADLLPNGVRIAVGSINSPTTRGAVISEKGSVRIALSEIGNAEGRGVETAMHEVTHAITDFYLPNASREQVQALLTDFNKFIKAADEGKVEAVLMRWADRYRSGKTSKGLINTKDKYEVDFGEWLAEQGVRYFRQDAAGANKTGFSKGIVDKMVEWAVRVYNWFKGGVERGHLSPTKSFVDFMDDVVAGKIEAVETPERTTRYSRVENTTTEWRASEVARASVTAFSTNPIAVKYGLTGLPVATTAERAKAKAILNLYKKADAWAVQHPKDAAWDKRAQNLIDNSVFSAASTGLTMLKSENPVARMIAAELLEDASNVKGYVGNTAAVSKYTHERLFLGNAINDVQNAYAIWRKQAGGSLKDDAFGGEYKARFDREVAIEIEARRNMRPLNPGTDPNVKAAADSLEKAYERIRKAQIDNKTLGWAALPKSSVGYMPHKISPGKWRTLSNERRQVVHDALVEQFVTIEGWDISFSDQLASRYLERVQSRANGAHDSPIGGANAGSAEIVEDALLSINMSADEVRKNMQKFNRGAAGWTKGRLDLDMNRVYDVNGEQFKLLDIFETDQIELLRSQAGRASGEVALARKGIYGRPGLEIIRKALEFGEDGKRGTDPVLAAYDQVAAEFMNAPFGNAGPKWMERARILNSVVRLGGIVFNQFAEFANAITHLGVIRTLDAVGSMPRLRQEIKDLAAGKKVQNSLLNSSELLGGAEFGTDAYKIVLPFDNHDAAYPVYGVDTVTAADRLLRGMSYAQGKLSMWRAVHSIQQRGVAEQVVAKMARYSREGIEDAALTGFGITPEMRRAIIADGVAKWDTQGSLLEFDVTKFADQAMAEDVVQAIHRGTSQIIQGTFIGETGKWAHDGYLKVLTQFRTFSLTAMEKQWGRQRNSHGTFKTLGLLLGSMSVVLPVYVARVYASSIGREDQEEFIEKRLQPEMIARQLLNYVAISNVAGEFIDMGATLLVPDEYGVKMTGGRAGTDTEFVGNMVAPSLSLVDDVWAAFQNLNDSEKIMRVIPGSRLPGAVPAINYLNEALSDFAD